MTPLSMLGYAILGILARGSHSGYDLMHLMKTRVGSFWEAKHSQIYPELARLEAAGLVSYEVIEQSDRPAKKVYAITEQGQAALRDWVNLPMAVPARRDEFVLRAFSLWLADPQFAIAEFHNHAEQHRHQLAYYDHILAEKCAGGPPPIDHPMFATYVSVHRGIGYEREYAAWCDWVADLIERGSVDGEKRRSGEAEKE